MITRLTKSTSKILKLTVSSEIPHDKKLPKEQIVVTLMREDLQQQIPK